MPGAELGSDAPAYGFQSRTLFGSVYADQVRGKVGLPAPTSYNVDDYSHARARWRASDEGRRIMERIKPALTEALVTVPNAPTMLKHIDYAVHPSLASSVLVPPERIAPTQVGSQPRPPLPVDSKLGSQAMMTGSYTGYTTKNTIGAGLALERLAGGMQASGPGSFVPPLGGTTLAVGRRGVPRSTSAAGMQTDANMSSLMQGTLVRARVVRAGCVCACCCNVVQVAGAGVAGGGR